jgi:hypothetical protein
MEPPALCEIVVEATPEVQLSVMFPPDPCWFTRSPYEGEVMENVPPVVEKSVTFTVDVSTTSPSATELVTIVSVVEASEIGVATLQFRGAACAAEIPTHSTPARRRAPFKAIET